MSASVIETRAKMADLARRMLSGVVDLLEGVHEMADLSRQLPEAEAADPDVLTFVAVDSELDDIPVGVIREKWAPEALAQKDRERDAYLIRAGVSIQEACRAIAARYS